MEGEYVSFSPDRTRLEFSYFTTGRMDESLQIMANKSAQISWLLWMIRGAGVLMLIVWGSSCVIMPPRSTKHPRSQMQVFRKGTPPPGGTHKWNPAWWFGNADDRVPPKWYRPGQKLRSALWQLRNPLHNFTFYVIGVADQDFVRYGHEPGKVFARDGGWNWAVIEKGWLRLPFISYEGKRLRLYALWRERGNFGLKATLRKKKPKPPSKVSPTVRP